MNNETTEPMYEMRKIMAWIHWSNNSRYGYAALLECGHKRTDLTRSGAKAHDAVCWECKPTEEKTSATAQNTAG